MNRLKEALRCKMPDARCKMLNSRFRVPGSKFHRSRSPPQETDTVSPAATFRACSNVMTLFSPSRAIRWAGFLPVRRAPFLTADRFTRRLLNRRWPDTQVIANILPVRLMWPKPSRVAQGARKSPGVVGARVNNCLGTSGLKPVAASKVAQLLMGRE